MAVRTTETTVTFRHPFTLTSLDGPQPAGTYRLVTDEEEILGLSFLGAHPGHFDFWPHQSGLPHQFRGTCSCLEGRWARLG
jgi:hypothetical protein